MWVGMTAILFPFLCHLRAVDVGFVDDEMEECAKTAEAESEAGLQSWGGSRPYAVFLCNRKATTTTKPGNRI
jgi:hypothetical protein